MSAAAPIPNSPAHPTAASTVLATVPPPLPSIPEGSQTAPPALLGGFATPPLESQFTPTDPIHVAVSKGQLFKVRKAYRDGWMWGRNVNTDGVGKVPMCVDEIAFASFHIRRSLNLSELTIGTSCTS
ncbi:hypothetical protein M427DRAFT_73413 [Gonapodya prolifera JEL478]|uniref:SH3 domain-containing protein n=1 Tax=Gonapodya prolifera (strain JEL478) TaxID=1344416 RepID=A0A139A351_GONPJ|nr:hypothetical protein M427DRAFT_73413 [Gonapodya prolifera JEL478]|eukprot:KXS10955.1 hypothetical protein M427DRAFT_73413 [Gonapodya prolifera JEL478]